MNLKLQPISDRPLPELDNFAIVLCGGGAAGRWQAGVLTGLSQAGITEKASVIAGTSVGGLNAGIFSIYGGNLPLPSSISDDAGETTVPLSPESDKELDDPVLDGTAGVPDPLWYNAVDVWESIKKNEDVYKGSMDLFGKIGASIGIVFNSADSALDAAPLRKRLDTIFGEFALQDVPEHFNTHLIISSLDLNTHREEFYCSFDKSSQIKVAEALKRTSAIPGVFASVPGQDSWEKEVHWHVDGGLGANNPFIGLNKYNEAFPGSPIKKVIIVYCYPDEEVDMGTGIVSPISTKRFKTMREVLLESIPAMLNVQEYITELTVQDKVKSGGWDVLALYPKKTPCDALDFTKLELLQQGYDYVVAGKGYSYKDKSEVNILDFLRKA